MENVNSPIPNQEPNLGEETSLAPPTPPEPIQVVQQTNEMPTALPQQPSNPPPSNSKTKYYFIIAISLGLLVLAGSIFFAKQKTTKTNENAVETPTIIMSPPSTTSESQADTVTANPSDTPKPTKAISPTSTPSESRDKPVITTPTSGAKVTSPLEVKGTVPANWMFEGQVTVKIVDQNKNQIAIAAGEEVVPGSWTTQEEVEFEASIPFATSVKNGYLIIENDNPSGLPQNLKTYEIPITF